MDEEQFLHQHYIANVSVLGGYSTQDIEYFVDLHNKIKDEQMHDKIREDPKVGGVRKFMLAFVAPTSVAVSPIARLTCHQASMVASTSSQSPMAMGAMSLLNEDSFIWKMFWLWFSAQIFAWTIMIIEYPMIGFLAMRYFFVHVLNVQIIYKLLVAMH